MRLRPGGRVPVMAAVVISLVYMAGGSSLLGGSSVSAASNVRGGVGVSTPATLPPVPGGLPTHFGYGLFNGTISDMHAGVPYDYRYQYLAGGVNTGDGWQTWGTNYAQNYVSDSRQAGYIPGFIYYNILQSNPGPDEITNLNDAGTMLAYYTDFKTLLQQMNDGRPAFVNIEPDLDGDMMQDPSNTNDDAALQPTKVQGSGMPELAGMADNFRNLWQALAHLRDLYAPNVVLGQDLSIWGADYDLTIALRNDPNYDWQAHADRTATYHNSFGPGYGLNFFSPLDRDAAYYDAQYQSDRWWHDSSQEPSFDTIAAWLGRIDAATNKRALMWQVPNGNQMYRSEDNTDGHYQDNRAEYFLNPSTGRSHMQLWANYGVIGVMFGAGAGGQSHYFDANSDGITNPAPVDGNNLVATLPDDDGGYIRLSATAYYAAGPLPLPGGQPVPTFTPGPTFTPAPTDTPVPGASSTPTPRATSTRVRGATSTPTPRRATATPVPPTPTPGPCGMQFNDVHESDYFYDALVYLYCHSAISGYSDGMFRPGNSTTRGQLSKIVVLAEGLPVNTQGAPHFRDVPASSPFYQYVETAYNGGIVSGYANGTFRPSANVTRGQLCKIIVQAQGWSVDTSGAPHFHDVPGSNSFFNFVETAYNKGAVSGYSDGTFHPSNSATRGQITKMVYNAVTTP